MIVMNMPLGSCLLGILIVMVAMVSACAGSAYTATMIASDRGVTLSFEVTGPLKDSIVKDLSQSLIKTEISPKDLAEFIRLDYDGRRFYLLPSDSFVPDEAFNQLRETQQVASVGVIAGEPAHFDQLAGLVAVFRAQLKPIDPKTKPSVPPASRSPP